MFKLQISSIFNFDWAHQSWISGVLGVKIVFVKVLNLQDFEGENKVAKIKRTNIHLLGGYKFHSYIEEQQIRIRKLAPLTAEDI